MKILVTGGAGYIGSHFVNLLVNEHPEIIVLVVDDLSQGSAGALPNNVPLAIAQVGNKECMAACLYGVDTVVHFAGRICVGESVHQPDLYWDNVVQTIALLDEAVRAGVKNFVFSSSAAVYESSKTHILEDDPKKPLNAYGASKFAIEMALRHYRRAFGLNYACLRYFNAAGADPSGHLRENHSPETHLIPLAIDAAFGGQELTVYGEDWETPDGSAIRDYVHVCDLAEAHLRAIGQEALECNLGTGEGTSVKQITRMVERVTGKRVALKIGQRREGDPPALVADVTRAREKLGWIAKKGLMEIVEDAVRSRRP